MSIENSQFEAQDGRMEKVEQNPRDMWNTSKKLDNV